MASSRTILFTLWLLVFSSASQIMILGPILPRIGEELGVDTSLLGVLMIPSSRFDHRGAGLAHPDLWYAQNVVMVGHVALYVVIPEILLGVATFRIFEATASRPVYVRVAGAVALMLFYLGALILFYFLIDEVFRGW